MKNLLVCALAACLGLTLTSTEAVAVTLNKFADPNSVPALASKGAIGFTYAGNKFVGSVYQGGQLYSTDLSGGSVATFGPSGVLDSSNFEHYVSSSYGLGGFPSRDIYVGDAHCTVTVCVPDDVNIESSIVHITNDGSSSDKFVGGLCGSNNSVCGIVRGILFDSIGTFGNNMLVSTSQGKIYQITSSGTVALLASLGEDSEGMDIIPTNANFGSFAGQLIVASEGSGLLRAISPSGVVTVLNPSSPIKWAEIVSFVPLNFGDSGNPLEGLYEANYSPDMTTAVWKADASQFSSLKGDLIVVSELTDEERAIPPRVIGIHWDGTNFVQTSLVDFPPQPEDGILLTPAIIAGAAPVIIPTLSEGGLLLLTVALGLLGMAIVRRRPIG